MFNGGEDSHQPTGDGMKDFVIMFRCFTGPGYWGIFKRTKAYDQKHADEKAERIAAGCFRNRGKVSGEFKAVVDRWS